MTEKSKIQIAFDVLEHVFVTFKNSKESQSNKHPVSDPNRIEHDLSELEKSHLDLLRAKMDMEIANEARESSEKLGNRIWWLNAALVLLSFAMVIAAGFELFQ